LTWATIATTYTVEEITGIKTAFPTCWRYWRADWPSTTNDSEDRDQIPSQRIREKWRLSLRATLLWIVSHDHVGEEEGREVSKQWPRHVSFLRSAMKEERILLTKHVYWLRSIVSSSFFIWIPDCAYCPSPTSPSSHNTLLLSLIISSKETLGEQRPLWPTLRTIIHHFPMFLKYIIRALSPLLVLFSKVRSNSRYHIKTIPFFQPSTNQPTYIKTSKFKLHSFQSFKNGSR
jgi:hypothetical protein